ncbi:TRAP transporter substrate-binding protein DctP [Halomonas sp. MCCC 1A11036]|uniref:TRAP transporter substrate-binding protein DctP n=1 Tax=Billgrantia zhangzhouensis TaxID=2733481 RepID=A0ABS9AJH6_9GAMM|nr:TRAP transporter substrate-binding protein DctP [Halomonas zhangzhouensis]MCE8021871.1 TRAP transporter substrate-binding protein DctP [Halomonas zhangzhouensis]
MTMQKGKYSFVFSCLTVATVAFSGTAMGNDDTHRFRMVNTDDTADSTVGRSVQRWADLIEERSGGRMTAQVFHAGALGNVGEVFDHMVRGSVDMAITTPQTSYDNRVGVMSLPYLFLDWEEAQEAWESGGWMNDIVDPVFEDMGLKHFGLYPYGFTGVATRGDYAVSLQESQEKGLRVRSIPAFPVPQTVQAMGYHSVPLDWNEVYTSIQTGVVDGDAGNIIYWDYQYFGDILDYFVHTKHFFGHAALMMNKDTWDALSEADQEIVASAAYEVIEQQFQDAREEDDYWIATAQEGGMEYIELSQENLEEMARHVRDVVWQQAESEFGEELIQEILRHTQLEN